MAPRRAGELPVDLPLRAVLTIRTGLIESNPRKGKEVPLVFFINERFDVFHAKISAILNVPEFAEKEIRWVDGQKVYLKAAKNASQAKFLEVDSTNFASLLQIRWQRITQADLNRLQLLSSHIHSVFEFQFFVYVTPPEPELRGTRRATVGRIDNAADELAEYIQTHNIVMGPIESHHVAVHRARQNEALPFEIPQNNTTRQAAALDAARSQIGESEREGTDAVPIRLLLFGSWVEVTASRSSLRAALGLPQHDIFTQGIFHGYSPMLGDQLEKMCQMPTMKQMKDRMMTKKVSFSSCDLV